MIFSTKIFNRLESLYFKTNISSSTKVVNQRRGIISIRIAPKDDLNNCNQNYKQVGKQVKVIGNPKEV